MRLRKHSNKAAITKEFRFHRITNLDIWISTILAAASLALYIRTLAPGLLFSDSGEFQTLARSLGMTHPTGYAVYIILGHIFSLLPLGSPAWEINLLSAVFGAFTVGGIYLVIRVLNGWRLAAASASLLLAVNPLFWSFSVIAELYIPASAFITAILLFTLLWTQTGRLSYLFTAGLLGGLTPGVHGLATLIIPAFFLYLVIETFAAESKLNDKRKRMWGAAISGGIIGLALTLGAFLYIDAQNPPAGYYNATVITSMDYLGITASDFDTPLERLKFIKFGTQFQEKMFDNSILISHSISFLKWLLDGFGWPSLILMAVGIPFLFTKKRHQAILLLFGFFTLILFIITYHISDITTFFPPTYIFLTVFIGSGLSFILELLQRMFLNSQLKKFTIPASILLTLFLFSVTVYPRTGEIFEAWNGKAVYFMQSEPFFKSNYQIENPDAAYTQAASILNAVEENAIVFVGWHELFPCYYVAIEESRTEVDFHQVFLQKGSDELSQSAVDYIAANLGARPIYLEDSPNISRMRQFELQKVERGDVTLHQVIGINP